MPGALTVSCAILNLPLIREGVPKAHANIASLKKTGAFPGYNLLRANLWRAKLYIQGLFIAGAGGAV